MRTIHPMTDEERAFAETWHPLVFDFLHRRKLPEVDYYDVVVFGFISAVQWYLANRSTTKTEFIAIAFRTMKDALVADTEFRTNPKRFGIVLNLDKEINGFEELTISSTIPDPRQNTAEQAECRVLVHQALRLATVKEAAILPFIAHGYSVTEAAKRIGIKDKAAFERLYHFRRRARAAVAG